MCYTMGVMWVRWADVFNITHFIIKFMVLKKTDSWIEWMNFFLQCDTKRRMTVQLLRFYVEVEQKPCTFGVFESHPRHTATQRLLLVSFINILGLYDV